MSSKLVKGKYETEVRRWEGGVKSIQRKGRKKQVSKKRKIAQNKRWSKAMKICQQLQQIAVKRNRLY